MGMVFPLLNSYEYSGSYYPADFSLFGLYERLEYGFEDFETMCCAILEKQDYEK